MNFKGKTALISGGSRGIGRAIAVAFAKAGADVAIIYGGNAEAAAEVCEEIRGFGGNAEMFECDVSDYEKCGEVVKSLEKIDILVNNAGITRDNLLIRMTEEDFDRVIAVNLKGVFNLIKHTSKIFLKQKSGRIINITSVSGLMGNAGQVNYSAAKAGVVGITKSAAKELAPRGITCNAVAPGFIATDMTAKMDAETLAKAAESIPLKRMGEPGDIAAAVLFLASDAAKYITGEVLKVDGGLYI